MIEELLKEIGVSRGYLNNLSKNSDKCYTSYYLEKSNGKKRLIDAPNIEIKAVQGLILRNILQKMPISERATGFVRGKNIKINARYHLKKNYIMCLDIKDFFPSIKYAKVYEIFNNYSKDNITATILTNICTYKGRLPQGGVTSPTISNVIFKPVDERITSLCNSKKISYSRYADDLAFSANDIERLKDSQTNFEKILNKEGFYLNENKTRFQTGKHRMLVTGLLLNSGKLTTGRRRKRILRATLHNYIVKNDESINMNKLIGTLSFIHDIEPDFYCKFQSYKEKLESKKF